MIRHRSVYRPFSNRFREMIMSGEFPACHKLPQKITATVGSNADLPHGVAAVGESRFGLWSACGPGADCAIYKRGAGDL